MTEDQPWTDFYGKWLSISRTIEVEAINMDSAIRELAVGLIEKHKPQLLVVHFYDTDGAGHKYGALSDEYRRQLGEVDKEIGGIIATLDKLKILDKTLLTIASDHSFTNTRHHGGWEKKTLHMLLTIRGPGVKRMVVDKEVLQDEIAGTISFFLRYRLPSGLTGGVLFDIFDVDERRKAVYQISLAEIKLRQSVWFAEQFDLKKAYKDKILRLEENLRGIKQLFFKHKYSEALIRAEKLEKDSENLIAIVKEEKHSQEVSSRLKTILLIYGATLIPLIAIVFVLRRRIDWKLFLVAIVCAFAYLLGFWVLFLASGWYFSVSVIEDVKEFESGTMRFTLAGLILGGIGTGFASGLTLKREYRVVKTIFATLLGLVFAVIINFDFVYVSIYYMRWNYILGWYFPEGLSWAEPFAYYLMLIRNSFLVILSLIAIVVALITLLVITRLKRTPKT